MSSKYGSYSTKYWCTIGTVSSCYFHNRIMTLIGTIPDMEGIIFTAFAEEITMAQREWIICY